MLARSGEKTIAPFSWQILSHQSLAGTLGLIAPIRPRGMKLEN